jgi:DNA polymerase-3 subunit alpha (Gram-positive type)
MHKNIKEVEFTIFDTETTGLDPESGDRIIEIAGIRFKADKKLGSFQTLVNPKRPVSQGAYLVNRISQEMLATAPTIDKVLPRFMDFISGSCLCSYNAPFDMGFLRSELKLIGSGFDENTVVVDILTMARKLLPGLERHALSFVAENLGIKKEQQHRAFSDVEITLEVFKKLKFVLKEKGIMDFNTFACVFGINTELLNDSNNRKIAKIQEAIEEGRKIKIRYLSRSDANVSEREVLPKEIKQENKRHYLIGFCCLRNDERTFRIDSILDIDTV